MQIQKKQMIHKVQMQVQKKLIHKVQIWMQKEPSPGRRMAVTISTMCPSHALWKDCHAAI